MIEIKFIFPVESDAHKLNAEMNKFFQGSQAFVENTIMVNPVKKESDKKHGTMWTFRVDIFSTSESADNKSECTVEKYIEISGGLLSLVNKGRDVWAFS
jgi:hypothetical protein